MAKKLGKFLVFSAAVGAAAAGVYYYLQNKNQKEIHFEEEDNDFDDFSEGLDDDMEEERGYVTLTPGKVTETVKKAADEAKDFAQFAAGEARDFAQTAYEGAKNAFQDARENAARKMDQTILGDETEEKVEEFFDDEDEDDTQGAVSESTESVKTPENLNTSDNITI